MNREIDNSISIPLGMQPLTMGHAPLSGIPAVSASSTTGSRAAVIEPVEMNDNNQRCMSSGMQSSNNKNMYCKSKNIFIFILFVCLSALFSSKAQTGGDPSLEGLWKLDSVEIKQITSKGDTVLLPYNPAVYANLTDCIYPILEIRKETGFIGDDNLTTKLDFKYEVNNNRIMLWITAVVSAEFEYTFQSDNSIIMLRKYSNYNNDAENLVRLFYNRE
jgi:hypothetical protein